MSGTLVLVEPDDELSLQAVALARGLGTPVHALSIAGPAEVAVDVLHVADVPGPHAPGAWAAALCQLAGVLEPDAVVAAGSDRGNEVLAHVGARLDLPVATNVTEIHGDVVTRVRWGGSLLEEARLLGSPKLITVAPYAVASEAAGQPASTKPFSPVVAAADLSVRVTGRVEEPSDGVSLRRAKVVVGGGRGVGSAEGFVTLDELAGLLGGAVGTTRAVTSAGWRPHTDQIGQTGTKIGPDLYIACGISGATQHIAGCRGAKKILAINSDPEAPIVARADYAVIGDLHEVVPAITAELKRVLEP